MQWYRNSRNSNESITVATSSALQLSGADNVVVAGSSAPTNDNFITAMTRVA